MSEPRDKWMLPKESKHCLICGEKLGHGFVFLSLTVMDTRIPYLSGYVCLDCQHKLGIYPSKREVKK
jgi:hypothetical protein